MKLTDAIMQAFKSEELNFEFALDFPDYYLKAIVDDISKHSTLPQSVRLLTGKALEVKEISAWVCANDSMARFCMEELSRRQIRVPQDIAIIRFDDSPQALSLRLSSYCFNTIATVNALLSYILMPQHANKK